MTDDDTPTPEPCNLFGYFEHLANALARKTLPAPRAAVAIHIALNGRGTTGVDCTVDDARLAAELDCSGRSVWRHVAALIEDGWLEQTARPAQNVHGRKGRRARYRLTRPAVRLSDDYLTDPRLALSDVPAGSTPPDLSDVHPPNGSERLTVSAGTSDTPTPENGTVLRLSVLRNSLVPNQVTTGRARDPDTTDDVDDTDPPTTPTPNGVDHHAGATRARRALRTPT